MPELPDVEVFRKYMESTALDQEIEDVDTMEAERIPKETTPEDLKVQLVGREFSSMRRHGKHLFAGLTDGTWLMMYFGMTGFLKYFKDEGEVPGYIRVLYKFTNGCNLAYDSCQCYFGGENSIRIRTKAPPEHQTGI